MKNVPGLKIECTFRTRARKPKGAAGDGKPGSSKAKPKSSNGATQSTLLNQVVGVKRRRGKLVPSSEDDEEEVVGIEDEEVEEEGDFEPGFRSFGRRGRGRGGGGGDDDDDDDEIVDDWSHTMRSDFPPTKRRKSGEDRKDKITTKVAVEKNREILILSD